MTRAPQDIRSHSHFSCLGCSLPSLLKRLGPERATAIYEEAVELYPRLPGEKRQMSSGQKRARAGFEGEDETVVRYNRYYSERCTGLMDKLGDVD